MLYQATHTTHYTYEQPVSHCLSEARLTPRNLSYQGRPHQRVLRTRIDVHPEPAVFERRQDYFGNQVSAFSVFRAHDHLTATATSIVDVSPWQQPAFPMIAWEQAQHALSAHPDADLMAAYEFVFDSPFVAASPGLADYARPTFAPGRNLVEAVQELSHRIHEEFRYKPKSTSIEVPLQDVLRRREGVCQDFAHVMIGALRSWHLAARYVSGYLRSGADVQGAEASHAWVAVLIPGYGWLDLDPTNDVIPSDGHITLAWGRDYGDVTPIKGITLGGGGQKVDVEVHVTPVTSE
jgi:transglutaminase-like putative cysteine protease